MLFLSYARLRGSDPHILWGGVGSFRSVSPLKGGDLDEPVAD